MVKLLRFRNLLTPNFRSFATALMLLVLMGVANNSYAQTMYYLGSDGNIGNTAGDAIYKVNQDGTGLTRICNGVSAPQDMALDIPNNRAFVSSFTPSPNVTATANGIYRIDLTSGVATLLVSTNNNFRAANLVYDPVNDYLYYTSNDGNGSTTVATDGISRIKSNGTGNTVLASGISPSPTFFGIDIPNNKIYIFESVVTAPKLMTYNLSGNSATLGSSFVMPRINGMDYDPINNWIYYTTDNGSTALTTEDALWKMRPDGTSQTKIISSLTANPNIVTVERTRNIAFVWNSTAGDRRIVKVDIAAGTQSAFPISPGFSISNLVAAMVIPPASKVATLSNFSISAGTLSPAFTSNTTSYTANVTYDKTTITVTPTKTDAFATIKVNGTLVTSGTASGALSLVPGSNTITTVVTAEDGLTTKTYTTTITKDKTPQTITFNALTAKTYGNADFNLGASASSTLTVSYTSDNNNVATVTSAGVVHIVGAGTVKITAAQAGDATYLVAPTVDQTLTVNKATLTYTANTANRDYGAANPTFTGTVTGFIPGENQAGATTGTPVFTSTANATSPVTSNNTTVINYPINGSGLSAANYSFVQATANSMALTLNKIAVTYTAQAATKVYATANPTFSAVFTGLVNGQTISTVAPSAAYETTALTNSPVGNYPITVTGLNALNYTFTAAAANTTAFAITKANLTFTAVAATRTYGTANPTFGGTITGFVNNESVINLTGTPGYATTATATSNIGSYPITLTGVSSANYTITAAPANSTALSITKGTLSYVANPASRAFNTSPNPALTGTVTGFANGETLASATSGTPIFTTAVTQSTPVGTYAITGSGITSANYNIVQSPVNATAFSIFLSSNGNLSSLAISQGTLSPAFSAGTNAYTATVSTGTTSITVTPALSDANAHVTVNGTEITPGTASASIPLVVGPNTIAVNVTAQNGTTTNPYTIVVTRLPSDDATLTSFSITGITLPTPDAFNNYRINVGNTVESYEVTATVHEPNAVIRINGNLIASDAATTIPLHLGENTNNILVTAQDGTTYGYTGVIITRALKSNNLLSSLTVNTGTLSPAFDSNTTNYVLNVSNATKTVDMTPVYDETATADEDGFPAPSGSAFTTVPLGIGDTEIPITVRAQNGAPKKYTVLVKRAVSTDATLADLGIMTTISGLDVPFDANTDTYNTTITSDVTAFRIKPVATNDGSSITVNGAALNPVNGNSYTMQYFTAVEPVLIEVTAGDGTTKKTYTINVVRNFSTNNLLATFGVNGYPVTPDFDPSVNNYTLNIADPNVLALSMIPLSQDPLSEVKVNSITIARNNQPYVPLHGGANTVAVSVRAFGSGLNTYTLTVNRAYSANANLGGLIVSAGSGNSYNHVFDIQFGEDLDLDVPNNVSSLSVQPIAADAGGTVVTVNGYALINEVVQVPIALGDNAITISITSGDNTTTKTYTAHINRLPFADVTLSALTTTSGALTPAFSPAVTSYTVVLPSNATTFSYSPVAASPTSVVTINSTVIDSSNPTYNYPFSIGGTTNTTTIVTAADGVNKKNYSVSFIKPGAGTAVLGNLSLSSGTLTPAFGRNTITYTASVPYSVSTINITPYSPDALVVTTVTNNGNTTTINTGTPSVTIPLSVGSNVVTTTTKSPNGMVSKTYTVTITRGSAATDATLANLYINNGTLSPVFSATQETYSANVDNTVNGLTIIPTTTDSTATVTVAGIAVPRGTSSAQLPLVVGPNTITTVVTAQSGATKTYTAVVNRQAPSANANLTDIILSAGTLSPAFDANIINYTATVADTSMVITPSPGDYNAAIKINGTPVNFESGSLNQPLAIGINTFNIAIKAQDSTTVKTYTLVVTRPNPVNITAFTPSKGAVGTLVNINGTLLDNLTALSIGGVPAIVVSNTGASISALVMPGATSGNISFTSANGTATSINNFTVTPNPKPTYQQGDKLTDLTTSGNAGQGSSVALSADGNTAIVGGSPYAGYHGAAWIYVRDGATWTRQGGLLQGNDEQGNAQQGTGVALSADGNTAAVGGLYDNNVKGAAWIYTRTNGVWTQQGPKLTGGSSVGPGYQAYNVALSADGNTLVFGGHRDDNYTGAVWTFTRANNTWTQLGGKLTSGTGANSDFGTSVALSADGKTLVAGGGHYNNGEGAAFIFTRTSSTWTKIARLIPSGVIGGTWFGTSADISIDGKKAIVGGPDDDGGKGAAWVFTLNGSTWSPGVKLAGAGTVGTGIRQGQSVALSSDGTVAMVGGTNDDTNKGATWMYTFDGTNWAQYGDKIIGAGAVGAGNQGAVAMSSDGATALIGGPNDDSQRGATWVFAPISSNADLASLTVSQGTMTTVSPTEYNVVVKGYAITRLFQKAATADTAARFTVNGAPVESGKSSGYIMLNAPGIPTTITTVVTAEDGITTKTYTVNITRIPDTNAELALLDVNEGKLTKVDTNTYTLVVTGRSTTQIKQLIRSEDPAATIKVNDIPVGRNVGTYFPLEATGPTIITTVITAEDGVTKKTYTLTVTKAPATNANLALLDVNEGRLTKVDANTYTLVVTGRSTTQIKQLIRSDDPAATIKVNDISVGRNVGTYFPLESTGPTVLTTVITAEDGVTQKTYTLTVTKAPATNANLALLDINEGRLTKVDANTYTLVVTGFSTTQIKQLIRSDDPAATIKVNDIPVGRNVGTYFPLESTGPTVITTVITAEDGVTQKTYTLTVTKAPATNANLALLDVNEGKLTKVDANTYTLVVTSFSTNRIKQLIRSDDPAATIKVNDIPVGRNVGTYFPLESTGPTVITTVITAEDGVTKKTYTLTVTKAPATNANISKVAVNEGKLTRVDASNYNVDLSSAATTRIKQLVLTEDKAATITVNNIPVTYNVGTYFPLNATGPTPLVIVITAEDRITQKTYTVTVNKPAPAMRLATDGPNNLAATIAPKLQAETSTSTVITPHQALSPNGDGISDYFEIEGISAYPDNTVTIINRNGAKVYEAKGYDNRSKVFDGHSSINGQMQAEGTYFYLIDYTLNGQKTRRTGYLIIKTR